MKSVKTDKSGKDFGAKKGKTYAIKVTNTSKLFRRNIPLLNHERFFIFYLFYFYKQLKVDFKQLKKFKQPTLAAYKRISFLQIFLLI
jgi:hypothetical protein